MPCAGKEEAFFRARYRNVAEPALLLHLVGLTDGLYAGEYTFLAADDKDVGKFQTLCRVHCHHDDAVGILVVVIHIGVQRNVGKIALERGRIGLALIVYNTGLELFYVLCAGIVLDGVLFLEHAQITRALDKLIVQKIGRELVLLRYELVYHPGKQQHARGSAAEVGIEVCFAYHGKQRAAVFMSYRGGGLDAFGSDAARRIVYDPAEAQIVIR